LEYAAPGSDLDPVNARKAVTRGIKFVLSCEFVLSCDAHSTRALGAVRFAVAMARRAPIRKRDVLNALPPEELAAAIRPRARWARARRVRRGPRRRCRRNRGPSGARRASA